MVGQVGRTLAADAGPVVRRGQRSRRGPPPAAYPVDTGPMLATLLQSYQADPTPLKVSFRELVHWIKVGERATHYIHPYPAKLLPHIAHFFLATRTLAGGRETILDPFAGTGTVALEAVLSGRPALHADANPLARLIAATKLETVSDSAMLDAFRRVSSGFVECRKRRSPEVVNIDRWFEPATIAHLVRLRSSIMELEAGAARDLMLVTFSAVVRKASLADTRFSVPVRRREADGPFAPADVWGLFEQQFDANRQRHAALTAIRPREASASSAGEDARALRDPITGDRLADGSIGMIVTSPPYAGAQKYVRATSLSLGWLGMTRAGGLRALEDRTIGREHFPRARQDAPLQTGVAAADGLIAAVRLRNPARAVIAATYLIEMRDALREAVRVLRPDGHMVLVIGDNTVCGERFATSEYLETILHELGMTTRLSLVDDIYTRGLMTRRAASAAVIARESVILLRKPASR